MDKDTHQLDQDYNSRSRVTHFCVAHQCKCHFLV